MAEFSYEVLQELGIFKEVGNGWTKEINVVSWNGGEEKYDIRAWAPEKTRMGKGISLSKDEIISLRELLNELDFD